MPKPGVLLLRQLPVPTGWLQGKRGGGEMAFLWGMRRGLFTLAAEGMVSKLPWEGEGQSWLFFSHNQAPPKAVVRAEGLEEVVVGPFMRLQLLLLNPTIS